MSRSTLKRSVAALGVVAGVLVAAAPASAQIMPGMVGVTAPDLVRDGTSNTVQLAAWPSKVEISARTGSKAPASAMWAWHEAARNGIHDARTPVDVDSNEVAVEGLTLVVTNNNDPDTMGRTLREPARVTMLDYEGSPVLT